MDVKKLNAWVNDMIWLQERKPIITYNTLGTIYKYYLKLGKVYNIPGFPLMIEIDLKGKVLTKYYNAHTVSRKLQDDYFRRITSSN
jgi:hypothetical protein